MKTHTTFSPVSLRYIAALRGNKPKKTGTEFTYADAACTDPSNLICLAASNPEGRFYGLVANDAARRAAEEQATQRGTFNVIFLTGTPSDILARLSNGSSLPPMLDYLCCDESVTPLSDDEHTALLNLAQTRMNAGGLFTNTYRGYDREDGALRYLVQQLAPEMNDAQKLEFLDEIKALGYTYLSKHPDLSDKLNAAIANKAPQDFFALFANAPANSAAFDMLVAAQSRGFAYAGDANLVSNFVEMVVPPSAQDLVVSCRGNYLYEPIKDLAMDRAIRCDIWVKYPAEQSLVPAELFGGFAYGLVTDSQKVPSSLAVQGKTIDLSAPLYGKIVDLMSLMPVGIGDILAHPSTQDENPEQIMEVIQVLVACGFACPMRGTLTSFNNSNVVQPRLVGSFNRFLDKTDLTDQDVMFASQVAGCGITLPAREAFVIQALNRAGLNNSVSALMPELRRIANTPVALSVIKAEEPTAEIAHEMIVSIVGKSLPQWYSYALVEAA